MKAITKQEIKAIFTKYFRSLQYELNLNATQSEGVDNALSEALIEAMDFISKDVKENLESMSALITEERRQSAEKNKKIQEKLWLTETEIKEKQQAIFELNLSRISDIEGIRLLFNAINNADTHRKKETVVAAIDITLEAKIKELRKQLPDFAAGDDLPF